MIDITQNCYWMQHILKAKAQENFLLRFGCG